MPLYHGTSSEAATGIIARGFDPARSGSSGTNVYGGGLYLTGDEAAARNYANARGGTALKMVADLKNPALDTDPDVLRGQVIQSVYGALPALRRAGIGPAPQKQLRQALDGNLGTRISADDAAKYGLSPGTTYRDVLQDVPEPELEKAVTRAAGYGGAGNWLMSSFLQGRGYDGVVVGDPAKPSEVVVFDPKHARAAGTLT